VLPDAARRAVIDAFLVLNHQLRSEAPIPGIEELGYEDLGEYYLSLATMVYAFDTPAARLALAQSAGGSAGMQRRAARAGDEAIPLLAERIRDGYEPGDALETMAFAWFWADSTGAPLSERSRGIILDHLFAASRGNGYELLRSLPVALGHARDPLLLPLARETLARLGAGEQAVWSEMANEAIPAMEAAASRMPAEALAGRLNRSVGAICSDAAPGARNGACRAMRNLAETARGHIRAGRTGPASEVLSALTARAAQALAAGALSADEHALIRGGATLLRDRVGG
ncbi:MAG TPA: hypothetical protein VK358_08645, partial [Longimicrobium sp.]|nr:hypothetical protein [Longimicrobium sp.]